jgi:hypothetical protein
VPDTAPGPAESGGGNGTPFTPSLDDADWHPAAVLSPGRAAAAAVPGGGDGGGGGAHHGWAQSPPPLPLDQ